MMIGITTICNIDCPWCAAKFDRRTYLKTKNKVITKYVENDLFEYIKNNDIKSLSITGGEPLLFPEIVKRIVINIRKEFGKDFRISILTNGLLLDADLVDFFNEYQVDLSISLSITGYKSLTNLIDKAKCPSELINLFKNLKYKRFHIVIDKSTSFAKEAFILHKLYNCNIEYTIDLIAAFDYTESDIDYIRKEIEILKNISSDFTWFTLLYGSTRYCTCTNNVTMNVDGEIIITHPEFGPMYGCKSVNFRLGDKLYNQYCIIANNFEYEKEILSHGQNLSDIY